MCTKFCIFAVYISVFVRLKANSDHQCETKTFDTDQIAGYCCVHYKNSDNGDSFPEIVKKLGEEKARPSTNNKNEPRGKFESNHNANFPNNPFLNNKNGVKLPVRDFARPQHSHERQQENNFDSSRSEQRPSSNAGRPENGENKNIGGPPGILSMTPFKLKETHTKIPKQPTEQENPTSQDDTSISFPEMTERLPNCSENGPRSSSDISDQKVSNMTPFDLDNRNGFMDVPAIQCPSGQGLDVQGKCVDIF